MKEARSINEKYHDQLYNRKFRAILRLTLEVGRQEIDKPVDGTGDRRQPSLGLSRCKRGAGRREGTERVFV